MGAFYRRFLFILIIYLSVFCRLITSQVDDSSLDDTPETTNTIGLTTNKTTTVPSTINSTVKNATTITNTSVTSPIVTVNNSSSTTAIYTNSSTTTAITNDGPSNKTSGPGWWLLVALIITIVIVIIAGLILYYRQHSPYRRSPTCLQWCRQCKYRFLQNWRSRDDDADNIILQLEQPDIIHNQWPPRISFS